MGGGGSGGEIVVETRKAISKKTNRREKKKRVHFSKEPREKNKSTKRNPRKSGSRTGGNLSSDEYRGERLALILGGNGRSRKGMQGRNVLERQKRFAKEGNRSGIQETKKTWSDTKRKSQTS